MNENIATTSIFKIFPMLFIGIMLASFGGVPYAKELLLQLPSDKVGYIPSDVILGILFVIQLSLFTVLGLLISEKVNLGAPVLKAIVSRQARIRWSSFILSSSVIGCMIGAFLLLCDYIFYKLGSSLSFFTTELPPWYKGLIGSFFGGIGEEIIYRLFFMSLLVWLINIIIRNKEKAPKSWTVWVAMMLAAILFALAHIPIASSLSELNMIVVTRGIFLNSIAGIGFGLLYWKKGLLYAMIAHFAADITLHVIAVLLFG
jgi:membrane protease YdiL (CAAX protease family)